MKKICHSLLILLLLCICSPLQAGATKPAETSAKEAQLLFTHDLHSHLEEFQVQEEDSVITVGGAARMKTYMDSVKAQNPNVLIVDAGDFSMGTLYQTIYEKEAVELRMLGKIGTEVTTLGNHEFDYRNEGLINMLHSAVTSKDPLPQMVLCNIDRTSHTEEQEKLYGALEEYGLQDYTILQKGEVRIAVIGVFGEDSLNCAPTCVLHFEDQYQAVERTVKTIKEANEADLIVCISHSGTSDTASKSEDEILAKKVPDIDLIISGHSHTLLENPVVHGDTIIVSSGEYGEYVGNIKLVQNEKGRWSIADYKPVQMNETIKENEEIKQQLRGMGEDIDTEYLAQFGYTKEQVLAENSIVFENPQQVYTENGETRIGDLLSDSYIYTIESASDYNGIPVACAVVPSGVIRDTLYPGAITVSDVFNVFSLGIGKDHVVGYPLVSIYLTGKELKTAAEVDASVSPIMTSARLYCSGLGFSFHPSRMILNKTTDVWLINRAGEREELEDEKLYRVVADLYSGQVLGSVNDVSKGILKLVPKDEQGNPVENFEDYIITQQGQEIKAWNAVAKYLSHMQQTTGGVDEKYSSTDGRKTAQDTKNLGTLIKNPNKTTLIIYSVFLIVALLILFLIFRIRRTIKSSGRKKSRGIKNNLR